MVRRKSTYLRQMGTALIMLLTFIVYVGNVSLFSHRHTIDGEVVVHSHLYSGSNEQPDHTLIAAVQDYRGSCHVRCPDSYDASLRCSTRTASHYAKRAMHLSCGGKIFASLLASRTACIYVIYSLPMCGSKRVLQ
jgi:hypothetical protein